MNGSAGTGTKASLNPPGIGFGSPGFPRATAAVANTAQANATTPTATTTRRPNRPPTTLSLRAPPLTGDSTPARGEVQPDERTYVRAASGQPLCRIPAGSEARELDCAQPARHTRAMSADETAVRPPDTDDEEGLGRRFWLKMAAIVAGIEVLVFVGVILFWRALYAWGFIGAFIVLAAALLLYGWWYDRKNPRPKF